VPHTYNFSSFGAGRSTLTFNAAEGNADPDGNGPAPPLTFENPDFNLKSLRAKVVFRDLSAMFSARGNDVLLVKLAYWIGR
jgi:hypothetical protein